MRLRKVKWGSFRENAIPIVVNDGLYFMYLNARSHSDKKMLRNFDVFSHMQTKNREYEFSAHPFYLVRGCSS